MKKSVKAAIIAATLTGTVAFTGCDSDKMEDVEKHITKNVAYGIVTATEQLESQPSDSGGVTQ